MKRIIAIIVLGLVCGTNANAQRQGAEDIFRHLEQSYDALDDYSAVVQADIDMERLRVPRMNATVYFKQPDKIHFESESFAMLPRDGVAFNPRLFTKNYTGQIEGIDSVAGIRVIKVSLTQKNDSARFHQLAIWVDTQRWVIVKLETVPFQGRQLTLAIEYVDVESRWWLPSKINVTLNVIQPAEQSRDGGLRSPMGRTMLPRQGTITLTYSHYKVNQHFSDELFEKKNDVRKK